jgi:hypothetical protein
MNVPPPLPAPDPADLRWAALAEAETLGQPLSPPDLAFLRMHVPHDPALRAEHALRWALPGFGEAPLPGEDDEAVIAGAVDGYLQGAGARGRGRVAWLAAAAGLAAAAAVVLAVGVGPVRSGGEPAIARVEAPAASGGEALAEADPAGPREVDPAPVAEDPAPTRAGAVRSLSGTWVDGGGRALAGRPAPGTVLTATSAACLGDDAGARLCVQPGARVRTVAAEGATLEWLDGHGELTLPSAAPAPAGPAPQAAVLELRVAGTRVTGPGARVTVETTAAGRVSLTVREGEVSLDTAEGTRVLAAGDRWAPGEDEPAVAGSARSSRATTPDATTLLRQAQAARAEGSLADAATLYRRLVKAYPRSPSAGPAWVALGQVELARGRAQAALEALGRYRGGPLAEEAAYGRIEALRALGRASEERAATERFLATYPGSSYAAKLRRRP